MTPISDSRGLRVDQVCRRGKGFTLLELLLVLTIIALAGMVVVPNVTNLNNRGFDVEVRQAAALLNYARREAVVRGRPASVTFLAPAARQGEGPRPSRGSVGIWQSNDLRLRYRNSADQETEIDDQIDISFYPEGGSTGGTLVLSEGRRRAGISIDPFTGRIDVSTAEE